MSDKNKITTPSSSTGLMRFYDVTSSNFLIDPKIVIGAAVALIIIEILFHVV